ncbi:MAG: hypothetical protein AABZ84_06190 [Pseudomonadota bacterium]
MAAWLIPALKAILPHVGTIVSAATPAFTKKKAEVMANINEAALLQQQISELQSAAAQNAGHIKELAEQLQDTVAALEQAASIAQAKLQRAILLCVAAAGLSVASLVVVLYVIFAQ